MENNGESTLRPSPDEARASLHDVRRMEADLADRLVIPWWYHPGLGLVEALLISSLAFPKSWSAPAMVIALAGLATATTAEFGTLRDALAVADSVTSKQLKVLTEAGYVKLSKPTGTGGRAKTWVALTPAGRRAFEGHLAMLQQMAADVSQGVG